MRTIVPIVLLVVLLTGFAGWLFSDDLETPNLIAVIKNIQTSLQQLDKQVKELHTSVKAMSKKKGGGMEARPEATPATPQAPGAVSAWQLARDAYDRGKHAEDLKSYEAAIEAFSQTIKLDAKNDAALLHRGISYYGQRDYAHALEDLNQSLALQPHNSRAYAVRASVLGAMNQADKGVLDANEAIQRDGKNPDNYLLRAGLYEQLGRAPEAMDDYSKAIALAPHSDQPFLARAAAYRAQGQVQKSLEDCYQAIQMNPDHAAAYLCRAQFYLMTGAAQPALEDINHAMLLGQNAQETTPLLSSAQNMLRGTQPVNLPAQQQPVIQAQAAPVRSPQPVQAEAAKPVQVAVVSNPVSETPTPKPVPVRSKAAAAYSGIEPTRGGALALQDKHDANYYYRQGRTFSAEEKFQEAVSAFSEAIKIEPNNAVTRNARGYAQLRLHRNKEALADFNEAIRLNPNYANAQWNRTMAMKSDR